MDESRLEEAVSLCEHGIMEEETGLLSGDDSFFGFTSFTGLLLESEQKKEWDELRVRGKETMTLTVINVSVDGKETWERPLTGWCYRSLPAGDSVSVHLPFYIWLSVQNLFISVNPTSIFFQMGFNFRRLEHGLPVNIYSHRKPLLESILSQMYVLLFVFVFVHVLPLDMVRSSSSVRPILETHEIWNQDILQHPSGSLSLFFSIYTIGRG